MYVLVNVCVYGLMLFLQLIYFKKKLCCKKIWVYWRWSLQITVGSYCTDFLFFFPFVISVSQLICDRNFILLPLVLGFLCFSFVLSEKILCIISCQFWPSTLPFVSYLWTPYSILYAIFISSLHAPQTIKIFFFVFYRSTDPLWPLLWCIHSLSCLSVCYFICHFLSCLGLRLRLPTTSLVLRLTCNIYYTETLIKRNQFRLLCSEFLCHTPS